MSRLKDYGYDWIAWCFFLIVPLIILYDSSTTLREQGAASGGPMENAALFPRAIAWLMICLAGLNAFRILTGRIRTRSPLSNAHLTPAPLTRLAVLATALMLAYLLALPAVGYHLLTPVLLIVLMRLFGLGWMRACLGAVAMSMGVAFVFEGLLNVVLPVGQFGISVFG